MKITSVKIESWKSFADTGTVELDNINVLVGRNNSGKSAFLQAIHAMQQSAPFDAGDIRLEESQAQVKIVLSSPDIPRDVMRHFGGGTGIQNQIILRLLVGRGGITREFEGMQNYSPPPIRAQEPYNYIYTYLSKRKVAAFERVIDLSRTISINPDLRYLNARVDRLSSPDYEGFDEYTRLCREVIGFRVGTFSSDGGHQSGITVGRHGRIPLEAMGEGVSSQLGLITDLCMADGNLFLIEEPENDIHPQSLKALLDAIIEKSDKNQFIVTTHSNIVVRYLGSAPHNKIFAIESSYTPNTIPTSSIREIESTPTARTEVLRDLGYELADFDLTEGWLFFEEASAERLVRDHLIPWFVERLLRVRTAEAKGANRVEPLFEDFRRLFLYANLEEHYKGRTWVIVDGDEAGLEVIESMKKMYGRWPASHFRSLNKPRLEDYYPARFSEQVEAAFAITDKWKRQQAKIALFDEVKQWCDADPDTAKQELAESAKEIIDLLKEIDEQLYGSPEG